MNTRKAATRRLDEGNTGRKLSLDADHLLDKLADAISLIATAASAIEYAEDSPAKDDPADWTDKARCLVLGLQELCRVRIDIAVALREVRP